MEPQIVDAVSWVRARPAQFFHREAPEPVELLAWVMADVLTLGGGECRMSKTESWWFVASNVDWLRHERFSPRELFSSVVADPRHGEHSMRAEILLSAFATDVFTSGEDGEMLVRGSAPPPRVVDQCIDRAWCKRLIAIRV